MAENTARWKAYRLVFRVKSPIHVGYRKYGNLMQTRPYVPARTILGAITSRLTRSIFVPTTDWKCYRLIGETLNEYTRFTYFYIATEGNSDFEIHFPWRNPEEFYHRFIGSHVSTSLQSSIKAAEEGSLHETEFISPRSINDNRQVYLLGYVFVKCCTKSHTISEFINNVAKKWKISHDISNILKRIETLLNCSGHLKSQIKTLTLGGERGYGWGRVDLVEFEEFNERKLFKEYPYSAESDAPTLTVPKGSHVPAHVLANTELPLNGPLEPLIRREWRRFAGSDVVFDGVAYSPGARVEEDLPLTIMPLGYCEPSQS